MISRRLIVPFAVTASLLVQGCGRSDAELQEHINKANEAVARAEAAQKAAEKAAALARAAQASGGGWAEDDPNDKGSEEDDPQAHDQANADQRQQESGGEPGLPDGQFAPPADALDAPPADAVVTPIGR